MKRRVIGVLLTFVLVLSGCSVRQIDNTDKTNENTAAASDNKVSSTSAEDILARLTLDQKTAQMVQGAVYNISENMMKKNCYGSILSTFGESSLNASEWKNLILKYQEAAMSSEAGIPYIYGNDAVHGVNTCEGTVIFPHNIGIGAANDKELTYQMGLAVANENLAKSLGHPTVTCIVAGRNVIISDYMKQWDGIVMCYLPGSEGDGIANVLTGKSSFKGTLPMPYYSTVEDIRTDNVMFPVGYGLKY